MPKYFNRAIVGNSKILACLDEKAELIRLYYPHIDYFQNIDVYKLGFVQTSKPVSIYLVSRGEFVGISIWLFLLQQSLFQEYSN